MIGSGVFQCVLRSVLHARGMLPLLPQAAPPALTAGIVPLTEPAKARLSTDNLHVVVGICKAHIFTDYAV